MIVGRSDDGTGLKIGCVDILEIPFRDMQLYNGTDDQAVGTIVVHPVGTPGSWINVQSGFTGTQILTICLCSGC
jgi:hypothetical protein